MRSTLLFLLFLIGFSNMYALSVSYSPNVVDCGTHAITATFDCAFNGTIFIGSTGGIEVVVTNPSMTYQVVNGVVTFDIIVESVDNTTFNLNITVLASDLGCASGAGNNSASNSMSHTCIRPVNDTCDGAISLSISQNNCVLQSFTTNNESDSGYSFSCGSPGYVDLWYKFVANNTTVSLVMGNLPGSFGFYSVIEGCGGTPVPNACAIFLANAAPKAITGLTVNTEYVIAFRTLSSAVGTGDQQICLFSNTPAEETAPIIINSFNVERNQNGSTRINYVLTGLSDGESIEIQRKNSSSDEYVTIGINKDFSKDDIEQEFNFLDNDLDPNNDNYYRLKINYLDGHIIYSDEKLLIAEKNIDYSKKLVYPNPTTGDFILDFNVKNIEKCTIMVQNMANLQIVEVHNVDNVVLGNNRIPLSLTSMPKGVNVVVLQLGEDISYHRIIKI